MRRSTRLKELAGAEHLPMTKPRDDRNTDAWSITREVLQLHAPPPFPAEFTLVQSTDGLVIPISRELGVSLDTEVFEIHLDGLISPPIQSPDVRTIGYLFEGGTEVKAATNAEAAPANRVVVACPVAEATETSSHQLTRKNG